MRVSYNLEALKKISTEELEKMYNENTKPTLKMVLKKINRKMPRKEKPKKADKE